MPDALLPVMLYELEETLVPPFAKRKVDKLPLSTDSAPIFSTSFDCCSAMLLSEAVPAFVSCAGGGVVVVLFLQEETIAPPAINNPARAKVSFVFFMI